MGYEGFRPDVTPMEAPFWAALQRHELVVQQCGSCGRLRFVPAELCSHCYSSAATWQAVSGRGTIATFTVVHRAPTPAYQAEAPYALAYVELEEGPRMPARLVDVDPAKVTIGMPVEVVFDDVDDDLTLYRFRPLEPGRSLRSR
jgi:uncharacterized OB-fold protein